MSAPRNEIHGAEWLVLALIVLAMGLAAHTARTVEERAKGKPTTNVGSQGALCPGPVITRPESASSSRWDERAPTRGHA